MKKLILSILFIAFVFAAIGQNLKGYYVEAFTKLEAKRAFVIDLDTFYATTQLSGIDTILATKEYVKSVDSEKVTGPASSTDNAIARFDGTTGKLIQNSGVILTDANQVQAPGGFSGSVITDLNTGASTTTGIIKVLTSGFQPANRPSGSNYFNGIEFTPLASDIGETDGGYKGQLGVQSTGTESDAFQLRVANSEGVWSSWRKLYHSGNLTVGLTANEIPIWDGNKFISSGLTQTSSYLQSTQTKALGNLLIYQSGNIAGIPRSSYVGNIYDRLVGADLTYTCTFINISSPQAMFDMNYDSRATVTDPSQYGVMEIDFTAMTPYYVYDNGLLVIGFYSNMIGKQILVEMYNDTYGWYTVGTTTSNTSQSYLLNTGMSRYYIKKMRISIKEEVNVGATIGIASVEWLPNRSNSPGDELTYIPTRYNGTMKVYSNLRWNAQNSNTKKILIDPDATNPIDVEGPIEATTGKFTNLTDNYLPLHQSDAYGLINSNVFQTSNVLRYNTTPTFSNGNDIVNKTYVDNIAAGNMAKLPVDAATTANITLSGTQTIDGYAVTAGMRVLVKDQSTASQNGVYTVASGSWTRTTDLDTWTELYKAYVAVLNGTINGGASYVCTIASSGTLGTDPITWVLYNAPANILVNSPLSKTGNTISLNYDTNTLDVSGGNLKVKDNIFQTLLNGTGFVKVSGTTVSYDNSTYLTAETDPIFAADSANLLHWSDTLNTTKGIASQYDLTTGLATKQNILTTGNLTENVTGLQFDATRQVIGGAAQLSLTSGYVIPTTTEQTNWTAGYNDKVNSLAFSGTTTKTLTLTQQDGGTVSNTFTDLDVQTLTADSTSTTIGLTASGSNSRVHFNVDKSATNELNNSVSWNDGTNVLTVNDAGGNKTATITGFLESEVDGSITNEGSLTVATGTSTTSIINSNTSGQTGVTLSVDGTNLGISETGNTITLSNLKPDQTVSLTGGGITNVSGTYPSFTITSNEVDGSTTNELQTLSKDSVNITNGKRYGISISSGNRITVTDMDSYPGSSWASTTNNSTNWNTAYTHSQNDTDLSPVNEIQSAISMGGLRVDASNNYGLWAGNTSALTPTTSYYIFGSSGLGSTDAGTFTVQQLINTIPNATTSIKGLASFNSSNFTVSSGAVSITNSGHSHNAATAPGTYTALVSNGGLGASGSSLYLSNTNASGTAPLLTDYMWASPSASTTVKSFTLQTLKDLLGVNNGGWTDGGTYITNTTPTDEVRIGSSSDLGVYLLQVSGNGKFTGSATAAVLYSETWVDANFGMTSNEIATPSTPNAGTGQFFAGSDSKAHYQNDSGVDFDLTNVNEPLRTISSTGTTQLSATDKIILVTGSGATITYPTVTSGKVYIIRNTTNSTITVPSYTVLGPASSTSVAAYGCITVVYNGSTWYQLD